MHNKIYKVKGRGGSYGSFGHRTHRPKASRALRGKLKTMFNRGWVD